jgi:hypothetical protein
MLSTADKNYFLFRRNKLLILFLTALVFRILLNFTIQYRYFPPDGTGYYQMAYNAMNGRGLSKAYEAPFEPELTREPAYPLFLMTGMKVFQLFGGKVHEFDLSRYDLNNYLLSEVPPVIIFLRLWQALFDSGSVILIFLILGMFIEKRKAFFIAMAYSLFIPVAIYNNILYREVFQTFVLLLMNFFFLKYMYSQRRSFLFLTGAFLGISVATLYTNLIILPFIFLFLLVELKSIKKAIVDSLIIGFTMFLFILPWQIYAFSHYPDIRIFRSVGSTLTPEWLNYYNAQLKAHELGVINDEELEVFFQEKAYNRPYYEYFDKSFTGYYESQADSILNLINQARTELPHGFESVILVKKIVKFSFVNFWINRNWGLSDPLRHYLIAGNYFLPLILYGISSLIGIFAVLGFFRYWKKFRPALLIFTSFLAVSYLIGSEARRLLPAYPFVFTFGMLMIMDVIAMAKEKWSQKGKL